MKKTILATLLTFGMIGAANADALNDQFNNLTFGASTYHVDGISKNWEGAFVNGTKTLGFGNLYATGTVDWVHGPVDVYNGVVAVGAFVPLGNTVALFGEAGGDYLHSTFYSDWGYYGSAGAKWVATDNLAITARINSRWHGSDNETSVAADVAFRMTDNWSLYGSAERWDADSQYKVGVRLYF